MKEDKKLEENKETNAFSENGLGEVAEGATSQPTISIHRQYEDRSIKWKFSNTVKEGWRLSELSGRFDESEDSLISLRKKLTLIATELTATTNAIPIILKE